MRWNALVLAAMAAALTVRPAQADTPPWDSLTLPAAVDDVRGALGIQSASPGSALILEVARKHFYLPGRGDARQPGFARLEQQLASAQAGPDRAAVVPLPGGPALWLAATARSGNDLGRALLLEREAALFYTGLASVDSETLAYLTAQPVLARTIYRRSAATFAAFGGAISVRNARVQVPGGIGAEALWTSLAGASPAAPVSFISALLSERNGRLAYFYAALASLDERHLRWVYGPAEGRAGRVDEIARVFESIDPDWRVAAQPFRRPVFDPPFALRFARVTPEGVMAGPAPVDALTYLRGIFAVEGAARRAFDAPITARRAFDGRAASWRAGAAVGEIRKARPALGIALERMGVTDAALAARLDRAAASLDARIALRDELTLAWQSALALASPAARHGSLDAPARDAALGALAAAVDAPDPFAAILDWLVARGGGEAGLIAWAAGPSAPVPFAWEGTALVVDAAAGRRQAMTRALAHPRRLTLDDISALRAVQEAVASRAPLDAGDLSGRLEAVMQRYDAAARVHAPLADGAAAYRELITRAGTGEIDPQARHLLSVRLLAAWRAAMIDALRVMVYAQIVNRPGTPAASAADFARRHRFQPPERVSMAPTGPWELARVLASGELRLDGSLLELDLAVPEYALRRPSDEMPAEPAMLAGERAGFARAAVLTFDAESAPFAEAAAAIASGRRVLADATTARDLAGLAGRAGMPATRAQLVAWDAARDPAAARLHFSIAEIAALGGLPRVPARWGTARLALDGCPCLGSPPPPLAWPDLSGRWDSGLLAASSSDLALRLIELAAAAGLPGELLAPVLLVATTDVIERADPSDPDDRDAVARAVATIDAGRFESYMLVLIGEGLIAPAGGRP